MLKYCKKQYHCPFAPYRMKYSLFRCSVLTNPMTMLENAGMNRSVKIYSQYVYVASTLPRSWFIYRRQRSPVRPMHTPSPYPKLVRNQWMHEALRAYLVLDVHWSSFQLQYGSLERTHSRQVSP